MKNFGLILVALVAFFATSCKSFQTYYEICNVSSSLTKTAQGNYEYTDKACSVKYDFWQDGGNTGFLLTNNTDEILYVDLSKSFFTRNGVAYDYFLNRTYASTYSHSSSYSYGGQATAYGFWNNLNGLVPGAVTATKGSNSGQSASTSVETMEKPVLAIPPHTSKVISEYVVSSSIFYDCGYNITPRKNERPTYNFTLEQSPINFSNYITYRIGDNPTEYVINNDFYISSVTFLHERAAKTEIEAGCPNEKHIKIVFKNTSPDKFYIRYSKEASSSLGKPKGPKGNDKPRNEYWEY